MDIDHQCIGIFGKTLFDININKNVKKRKFKNIDIESQSEKYLY